MEEFKDAEDLVFHCDGTYQIGGDTVVCEGVHGDISLKTALAQSCNCAFAQLSEKFDPATLQAYIEKFQLTEPVEFDGIRTATGKFDVTDAAAVNVAWAAIGQYTDLMNPCRYMTFMGCIANGGKAAEPYLVANVTSGGIRHYKAPTHQTDKVLSSGAASILAKWMRNNVETVYGDGRFPDVAVCAKSGTAQVGGGKEPNATFAGFVQDADYPLAFIVVVENGGAGASACVPIISPVLEATALGLGSTWIMYFIPEALRVELALPASCEPVAILLVGYADDAPSQAHFHRRNFKDCVSYR